MKYSEHQFQAAAYVYIRAALPEALVWSVDHAGKRTPIQGARLKQRGVVAGIPDVFVYYDRTLIGLELKAGANSATYEQRRFGEHLVEHGAWWRVVRSIEEIEVALRSAGLPLRATTMTAQDRDARMAAKAPPKPSRKRAEKPPASRVRKVQAIMSRYLPPDPVYTGPKK